MKQTLRFICLLLALGMLAGLPYALKGNWNLVANGDTAGRTVIAKDSGSVTVEAIGIRIYVNDKLAN